MKGDSENSLGNSIGSSSLAYKEVSTSGNSKIKENREVSIQCSKNKKRFDSLPYLLTRN